MREKIDWDFFKSEPNHMKTIHNPTQGVSHGQNPHSGTVDQGDEERKSDPGLISSNTQQDGNDSFENIGDEAISTDEYDNQTGSHNASLLGTFNEVASSFTSYMSDCAGSVMHKAQRMIDVIRDKDLEQTEALKSAMADMGLETEKLKSLLALQEKEIEDTGCHNEELQKRLEIQQKKTEAMDSQLKFLIKKYHKNDGRQKKKLDVQKKEIEDKDKIIENKDAHNEELQKQLDVQKKENAKQAQQIEGHEKYQEIQRTVEKNKMTPGDLTKEVNAIMKRTEAEEAIRKQNITNQEDSLKKKLAERKKNRKQQEESKDAQE